MTHDRPAPGALPPLARPDLRRDRRPGGRRRDAAQRRPRRTGSATPSCSSDRAARARRRSPGSSPRPSTARPPGRRRLRPLPVVRLDPRGHDRSTSSRSTPRATAASTPSATCASGSVPARPAPAQGLHPRRGAPDHEGRLERAAEVARGAARLRHLHVRLDRAVGLPAGDPVAPPALRRPAPDGRRDRGQARRGSSPPTAARPIPAAVHLIARLAAGGMRDAESMLDQLLSPRRSAIDESTVRDLLGLADAEVVERSSTTSSRRRRAPASRSSTTLDERGRDLAGAPRPGGRGDPRRAGRRRSDPAGAPARPGRPGGRRPPAGRDRPEPRRRSAACASSSSSRCSSDAGCRAGQAGAARARAGLRRRRGPAHRRRATAAEAAPSRRAPRPTPRRPSRPRPVRPPRATPPPTAPSRRRALHAGSAPARRAGATVRPTSRRHRHEPTVTAAAARTGRRAAGAAGRRTRTPPSRSCSRPGRRSSSGSAPTRRPSR